MNDDTTFNTAVLSDHDLLHGGVVDLFEENRANARRWARMVALHQRAPEMDGPFAMSAREWATLRISEVWAYADQRARTELNNALFTHEHLPGIWELCADGTLDHYRASTVANILRLQLHDPADWAIVAVRITAYLRRQIQVHPEYGIEMITSPIAKLRNKINYECRKLRPKDEEFERSFAGRSVQANEFDDGMAELRVGHSVDQVRLARHRLHLSAKALRAQGDERTIDQLMADIALDLLVGRGEGIPVPPTRGRSSTSPSRSPPWRGSPTIRRCCPAAP